MNKQRSERTIDGVQFTPVLELSDQLHPLVFSFLAIVDVPVFHRLDNRSLSFESYYVDEQTLLSMLKPSTIAKKRRSIHALDSVNYLRECFSMDNNDAAAEATHWSQVARSALLENVHPEDVSILIDDWRLTGRKVSILSLAVFRYYVMDLERSLRHSVQKIVEPVIRRIARQHAATSASTGASDASFKSILLTLNTYPSFDTWWLQQCTSSLCVNIDASAMGTALTWLVVWADIQAGVNRSPFLGVARAGDEAAVIRSCWRLLGRTHADDIADMEDSFTRGTLWTTGTTEEQSDVRANGLAFFRGWFDSTVLGVVEEFLVPRPGPWTLDDSRPAATPMVRRKKTRRLHLPNAPSA